MIAWDRWTLHVENWKDCNKCQYAETRRKIVLGRGVLPCDIAFIGEAPGVSENMLGQPFIGKAGKILDRIILKALGHEPKYTVALNNVIACIPLVNGHEKEEPDFDCVMECKPRVEEFLSIASPKLIVAVGKTAAEWLDSTWKDAIQVPKRDDDKYCGRTPVISITHPAAILRMPFAAQGLAEHKCVVDITTAIAEYL